MLATLITAGHRAKQINQHLRDQLLNEDEAYWKNMGIWNGHLLDQYLATSGPGTLWEETDFSGDSYRHYEAPITFRWSLSVNRYGSPRAKLALCGDGGGRHVMEIDCPFTESDEETIVMKWARDWARQVIEDGSAVRAFLFPPAVETIIETEEEASVADKYARKETVFPGEVEWRLFLDEDADVTVVVKANGDTIDTFFTGLDGCDEAEEVAETILKLVGKARKIKEEQAAEDAASAEQLVAKLSGLDKTVGQIAREHLTAVGVWSTLSSTQMQDIDPDFDPLALQ